MIIYKLDNMNAYPLYQQVTFQEQLSIKYNHFYKELKNKKLANTYVLYLVYKSMSVAISQLKEYKNNIFTKIKKYKFMNQIY